MPEDPDMPVVVPTETTLLHSVRELSFQMALVVRENKAIHRDISDLAKEVRASNLSNVSHSEKLDALDNRVRNLESYQAQCAASLTAATEINVAQTEQILALSKRVQVAESTITWAWRAAFGGFLASVGAMFALLRELFFRE